MGLEGKLFIKGIADGFHMGNQMRKILGIVIYEPTGRICVKVEMISGVIDYVPMVTQ